jgi:integrase
MKKFLVSDSLLIEILTRYMNSFDTKTGRSFRKIKDDLTPSMVPIGQGMISSYPKKIAEFLQLPDPNQYTSHSFRHSGATILADDGATVMQLQRGDGRVVP